MENSGAGHREDRELRCQLLLSRSSRQWIESGRRSRGVLVPSSASRDSRWARMATASGWSGGAAVQEAVGV
ncbi:hypothetical protein BDA96_03G021500 [Sorghum bicolor]|uniref:Uncharacterized protein n=2 Tax=Sorghum bicolor TaxID=4558 RepID=A0A921UNJ8_SORBI|nr:hypothetical protein BDA96_03G021500 [Sorghum bicolor]KXG31567.1 hypothetical protein SORBI_3003G019500 [Sorghum bicolor]